MQFHFYNPYHIQPFLNWIWIFSWKYCFRVYPCRHLDSVFFIFSFLDEVQRSVDETIERISEEPYVATIKIVGLMVEGLFVIIGIIVVYWYCFLVRLSQLLLMNLLSLLLRCRHHKNMDIFFICLLQICSICCRGGLTHPYLVARWRARPLLWSSVQGNMSADSVSRMLLQQIESKHLKMMSIYYAA